MRSHGLPSKLLPCAVCGKPFRSSPGDGNTTYCSRSCYRVYHKAVAVTIRIPHLRAQILEAVASGLSRIS